MNKLLSIETNQQHLVDQINTAITTIMIQQKEIAALREKRDNALPNAGNPGNQFVESVDLAGVLELKMISDDLEEKIKINEAAASSLHNLIFPNDIFITQHYFDSWIKISPQMAIQFSFDLNGIEIKSLE
ncbi:MAG: hypothetical protein M3R25_11960 [Bacteroidota bacterium]|nr:hypothetical protein [Bacteroidota bacterium]